MSLDADIPDVRESNDVPTCLEGDSRGGGSWIQTLRGPYSWSQVGCVPGKEKWYLQSLERQLQRMEENSELESPQSCPQAVQCLREGDVDVIHSIIENK